MQQSVRDTVECGAADEVRVVKVEFTVEVSSNELLGCLAGLHVETDIFPVHFTISRQLHSITTAQHVSVQYHTIFVY